MLIAAATANAAQLNRSEPQSLSGGRILVVAIRLTVYIIMAWWAETYRVRRLFEERESSVNLRLSDLADMHPSLLWAETAAAAAAVLDSRGFPMPCQFPVDINNVAEFGTGRFNLEISRAGISADHVLRLRRTWDSPRLVELAAIAIAGLALFAAGGHQIRNVALRGTSADYLVDADCHLLEVAGRSRRTDFDAAWQVRWERLLACRSPGFYVCVCEFESPSARLAFA